MLDADWVVLGPGSWFSSVIPHLLVPELLQALTETKARRVLSLNLAPQPGKPPVSPRSVIWRFWPDTPLNSPSTWCWPTRPPSRIRAVCATPRSGSAARSSWRRWPPAEETPRHDPELLAAAYDRIFRMHGRIGPWR
ncbi:2-phospho-L-lactate transferase CofD family protein [Streptomyces sp. M19]